MYSSLQTDAFPLPQKSELLLCMEPVFAVFHHGQAAAAFRGKGVHNSAGDKVIPSCVQNLCGNIPLYRVFAHPTEIPPRQSLPKL